VRTQLTRVVVPQAVWEEMLALPHPDARTALLSSQTEGWLQVATLANLAMAASLRLAGLDQGESEAIALAVETSASLLLMDEKKGRIAARRLGVPVSGALAIVAAARRAGQISSARTEIARLRTEAGFSISSPVEVHSTPLAFMG
jgi:uncharacterized protein